MGTCGGGGPCSGGGMFGIECVEPQPPPPPASEVSTGPAVVKTFAETMNCNTDAQGVIGSLEAHFSQFANYSGFFGPLGLPAAYANASFGNTPIAKNATIPISLTVFTTASIFPIGFSNVSVTVSSVSSTSFSFVTNPGHVLNPASIAFSASNVGNGRVSFAVGVVGDFASSTAAAGYYAGGRNLEANIWNHLLKAVEDFCNKNH